jgi:hypothetical protein
MPAETLAPHLVMVPCPPMSARLTIAACNRMWRQAQDQRPAAWQTLSHCRACSLGAERAGADVTKQTVQAATDALRLVCSRCTSRAPRLIHGKHCISCYNRDAEVRRGRNGKGGRPRLTDVLHVERVAVVVGGEPRVHVAPSVVAATEAVIGAAKAVRAPAFFGRPPAALPDAA